MLNLLKIIALVNFLFLMNTDMYKIVFFNVPTWLLNISLVLLLIGSFSKDLYSYMNLDKDETYKQLDRPIQVLSAFSTVVVSSFALLIPKILYLESNYLDSVRARFGITITRIWSKEELNKHISEIIASRNLPPTFISERNRDLIIGKSDNKMVNLKQDVSTFLDRKIETIEKGISFKPSANTTTTTASGSGFLHDLAAGDPTAVAITVGVVITTIAVSVGAYLYFTGYFDGGDDYRGGKGDPFPDPLENKYTCPMPDSIRDNIGEGNPKWQAQLPPDSVYEPSNHPYDRAGVVLTDEELAEGYGLRPMLTPEDIENRMISSRNLSPFENIAENILIGRRNLWINVNQLRPFQGIRDLNYHLYNGDMVLGINRQALRRIAEEVALPAAAVEGIRELSTSLCQDILKYLSSPSEPSGDPDAREEDDVSFVEKFYDIIEEHQAEIDEEREKAAEAELEARAKARIEEAEAYLAEHGKEETEE